MAARAALGIAEGGLFPGMSFFIFGKNSDQMGEGRKSLKLELS